MQKSNIVVVPLASPLHNPKLVDPVLQRIKGKILENVDYVFGKITDLFNIDSSKLKNVEGIVIIVLTGGTEKLILDLVEMLKKPVILIAHDSQNSLAASVEALSSLKEKGYYAKIILEDELGKVKHFTKAIKALSMIKGLTLVSIGKPSPWLVYSSSSESLFRQHLGLKIEYVDLGEVLKLRSKVSEVGVVKAKEKWQLDKALKVVGENELNDAIRLYLALKRIIDKYNAHILTIRCFDLLRYNVTACLALSILNSEGIVAGCEADIPATVSMAILSCIANAPSFMGNVVWVSEDKIFFAHCTIALNMVSSFTLKTHFESGLSVAIEGHPRKGELVTFAKIDPKRRVILAGKGMVLNEKPLRYDNCRTQILVKIFGKAKRIIEDPAGNHFALTYGDHLESLRYFTEILGYRLEVV